MLTRARSEIREQQLLRWMEGRNGVSHTSDAKAAGFRDHEIAFAVGSGRVRRIRRSWLVTAECDWRRVDAASVGGRLTCVSAAALRGLWIPHRTPDDNPLLSVTHVAVAGTSSRHNAFGLHLHWGTGPAPVGRNTHDDPVLNVLFHVAQCLPRVDALAVWESAIRKKLTSPGVLRRVAWRRAEARAIANVASALSDSGLETHFVSGMRTAGVIVKQQVWIDGAPVDGLIGDSLVVQLDGFLHHSTAADRRRDIAADSRLVALGYTVLRFDYAQVLFDWAFVLETILTAIAQDEHRLGVYG